MKIDEIAPFIIHGLTSTNSAVIKNSCGVLNDLCTQVEAKGITEGFEEYMPILLDHLKNENIDRRVKVIIITVIGDTFLMTKNKFKIFLEESLAILESAAFLSIKCDKAVEEDREELAYLLELQSALIECYTCFVQNIREAGDNSYQTLGQFICAIFGFLIESVGPVFQPNVVSQFSLNLN